MEEVDEVIVPYVKEDIEFIKSLTSKEKLIKGTIIISVEDIADFYDNKCLDVFKTLKNNYPDVHFKLRFLEYIRALEDFYNEIKKYEIPFFFSQRVRDWDSFNGMIDLGVSDIYIVEELGFSLGKIGPIAHEKNISIRVFANVAQSRWEKERSIKSFFIRPEDVPLYEGLVDVIEFFGSTKIIQETLYKVYSISKKWFGPLNEIIIGLESDVDSRSIIPGMFAKYRINCDKRCNKGSSCSICDRFVDISKSLLDQGVYFKYKK